MIRIFVSDDHAIVRRGLRQLFDECDDMQVVGEASNGREVLTAIEGGLEVDVLVLDLSLPRVNGTEVLRRLVRIAPDIAVVVLSMYPEEQYAQRMFSEGAATYVGKDRPPELLVDAIRRAARGEKWLPPGTPAPSASAPHDALSAREHQVFTLLFQGQGVSDIAAELNVTSSTVSNHVSAIRNKLGVRTINEIVNYAHRMGLID